MRRFIAEPPPEFRGLDPQLPVEQGRRNLPHRIQDGATYFVTFRLSDSLPSGVRLERRVESTDEQKREMARKVERELDAGHGDCLLKSPVTRKALLDAWKYRDGTDYELFAMVIMPNHVHLLVSPKSKTLSDILRERKSFSARAVNRVLQRKGRVWQSESFDRIVRNGEHLWRCLQYIGRNPMKARLSEDYYTLWIKPEWKAIGWDFDFDVLGS